MKIIGGNLEIFTTSSSFSKIILIFENADQVKICPKNGIEQSYAFDGASATLKILTSVGFSSRSSAADV